jgi:Coenzyme F420-reducing hydrogenase, alpha subunit
MHVRVRGGAVEDVRLEIYEPPRFFEAFLRGRQHTEPPDITARICGICPVAYQMSACLAIEAACGIEVTEPIADLRRLLYCGEWIESHALHIYLLHAPDFLGYTSALALAEDRRDLVERGLALKKAGNAIMELVGGRAIHPVNVRVGGFYRARPGPRWRPWPRSCASRWIRRWTPCAGRRVRVPRLPSRPRDAGPGHARGSTP